MTTPTLFDQPRRMHKNSLAAYASLDDLPDRCRAIYGAVRMAGVAGRQATDRRVMRALGMTDPNSVRPRISEMIDAGILKEVGSTKDTETNRTVRVVALADRQRR